MNTNPSNNSAGTARKSILGLIIGLAFVAVCLLHLAFEINHRLSFLTSRAPQTIEYKIVLVQPEDTMVETYLIDSASFDGFGELTVNGRMLLVTNEWSSEPSELTIQCDPSMVSYFRSGIVVSILYDGNHAKPVPLDDKGSKVFIDYIDKMRDKSPLERLKLEKEMFNQLLEIQPQDPPKPNVTI
ncbi:MAG: hypothetical protein RL094_153 [Candidatus Parcubacteria bacterium]|jgi:hypothetical protein